jgi:hypothetical protein
MIEIRVGRFVALAAHPPACIVRITGRFLVLWVLAFVRAVVRLSFARMPNDFMRLAVRMRPAKRIQFTDSPRRIATGLKLGGRWCEVATFHGCFRPSLDFVHGLYHNHGLKPREPTATPGGQSAMTDNAWLYSPKFWQAFIRRSRCPFLVGIDQHIAALAKRKRVPKERIEKQVSAYFRAMNTTHPGSTAIN